MCGGSAPDPILTEQFDRYWRGKITAEAYNAWFRAYTRAQRGIGTPPEVPVGTDTPRITPATNDPV